MTVRAACADCGGLNPADAAFCGQCLTRPFRAGEPQRVTSFAGTAAPPMGAPAVAGSFQSFFDQPSSGVGVLERPAPPASLPPPPAAPPASVSSKDLGVRWRWAHLWAFGFCAWGVPRLAEPLVSTQQSLSQMLDEALLFQIFGYLLAVIMACFLVARFQGGDWSSLGLSRPDDLGDELLKGAGFGLLLLGAWMPVGFLIGGRKFELDLLIRTLVGETSGLGLLLAGLVVVLGAPLIEEIYYRGMLYEKLARKSVAGAVVVTSILFVGLHGSFLILPLYVLAVGVGLMRRTRTVWFTIAAHGAWNFAVLVLAGFILFSPAKAFSAEDGSFSLRHPSSWQRVEEMEVASPMGGRIDLALEAGDGSAILVQRFPVPGRSREAQVPSLLGRLAKMGLTTSDGSSPERVRLGASLEDAWEQKGSVTDPTGVKVHTRTIVTLPRGWDEALAVIFACPAQGCSSSGQDFEKVLDSLRVN